MSLYRNVIIHKQAAQQRKDSCQNAEIPKIQGKLRAVQKKLLAIQGKLLAAQGKLRAVQGKFYGQFPLNFLSASWYKFYTFLRTEILDLISISPERNIISPEPKRISPERKRISPVQF